jgi:hypothetical protein
VTSKTPTLSQRGDVATKTPQKNRFCAPKSSKTPKIGASLTEKRLFSAFSSHFRPKFILTYYNPELPVLVNKGRVSRPVFWRVEQGVRVGNQAISKGFCDT